MINKKYYKIPHLMQRYNIRSKQGMLGYVQKHLEEINADGVHVQKKNGEWVFDEKAIEIIDELRDTKDITIIEDNSEQVKELTAENEQLKQMLIAVQNKLIEAQSQLNINQGQIITLQGQLNTTQTQLLTAKNEIKSIGGQLATAQTENEGNIHLKAELKKATERAEKAETALNSLRQRSLIDRLLNRE